MKYMIKTVKASDDILYTEVEYEIDGKPVSTLIPHFQPSTKEAVLTAIENRFFSESTKAAATVTVDAIAKELAADIGKTVDTAKVG